MEFFHRMLDRIQLMPHHVLGKIVGVIALVFLLYYPMGMLIVHTVDDRANYAAGAKDIEGGSHAVAIATALLDREVNQNHWTPNDPWFLPGAALDRMPAFQKGVISSLSRFTIELADQLGRTRGSSQSDPDLDKAKGYINYQPDVFWVPTATSGQQYNKGLEHLASYNARLAKGQAVYERRSDNLMELLNRIATDLGASSAVIEQRIRDDKRPMVDTGADEVMYFIKGRMYADYLLMRELGKDFAPLIKEKQLQSTWDQALETLREGAQMRVFMTFNAAPDSQFLPNHLAAQGFYLVRARGQLYEISNTLLK